MKGYNNIKHMLHFSPRFKQVVMIIIMLAWLCFAIRDLYYHKFIPGIIKLALTILFTIIYSDIENFKD